MKKELKDYAPFYLGCDVRFLDDSGDIQTGTLIGVKNKMIGGKAIYYIKFIGWEYTTDGNYEEFKLILRPLSDITEEEEKEMIQQKHKYDTGNSMSHAITDHSYRVAWAISKHFDLFGLIECGLAVNSTELKTVTE